MSHTSMDLGAAIHKDVSLILLVIPGLTRNPVVSRIPAFAGMTCSLEIIRCVQNGEKGEGNGE
jgi:hypothetical protein